VRGEAQHKDDSRAVDLGARRRRDAEGVSDGFVAVGRIGRPHGLDGSFVVEDPSANESLFEPGATVYVAGEPAAIVGRKRSGRRLVLKLDGPAERGAELTVPRAQLPEPDPDSYYVFQLVGLDVVEEGGRRLGAVRDVAPGVANDVLELDSGLALPMHEECVREVDLSAGRIVVAVGFADR
jgi:16S rRNA processing protein RimM